MTLDFSSSAGRLLNSGREYSRLGSGGGSLFYRSPEILKHKSRKIQVLMDRVG